MARARTPRLSFAKIPEVQPLPGLLSVQHDSFGWFLEHGLKQIFSEVSPIEDFTGSLALELTDHRFGDPPLTIDEAKEQDSNYSKPLFVTARFLNRDTGEIKEQQVFLGDFPMMTANGTFIINGTERVVVSQLVRSPGVYFDKSIDKTSDRDVYAAKVIPGRGAWLEFDIDKKDTVGVRVDRKRRQYVTTFLRALGFGETDEEILALFNGSEVDRQHAREGPDDVPRRCAARSLSQAPSGRAHHGGVRTGSHQHALLQPEALRPHVVSAVTSSTRSSATTRPSVSTTTGSTSTVCSRTTTCSATINYLIELHRETDGYRTDDIDHFANRRVRTVGELIQNQIRVGLSRLERVVRERMTTQDPEAITPQSLINIRPVVASIKEFFGTSQLSQFMDQPNPLAGLTHRRRLSALGPGGLSRERAGFEVRDVHPSHYGRMCPIETPEGPEHRSHRLAGELRQGQPVRVHRDAISQGREGQGHQQGRLPDRLARRSRTSSPRPTPSSTMTARSSTIVSSSARRGGEVDSVLPERSRLHGRVAEAGGVGVDVADSVPRARRRQPCARWVRTCSARPCRCCGPMPRSSAPASRTALRRTPAT